MIDRDEVVDRIVDMMPMLEPITYLSKNEMDGDIESGTTEYAVPQARPRRVSLKDLKRNPTLVAAKKVFELYSTVLAGVTPGGFVPKKEDHIVDQEGQSWRVLEVEGAMNQGVFNCFVIED